MKTDYEIVYEEIPTEASALQRRAWESLYEHLLEHEADDDKSDEEERLARPPLPFYNWKFSSKSFLVLTKNASPTFWKKLKYQYC